MLEKLFERFFYEMNMNPTIATPSQVEKYFSSNDDTDLQHILMDAPSYIALGYILHYDFDLDELSNERLLEHAVVQDNTLLVCFLLKANAAISDELAIEATRKVNFSIIYCLIDAYQKNSDIDTMMLRVGAMSQENIDSLNEKFNPLIKSAAKVF